MDKLRILNMNAYRMVDSTKIQGIFNMIKIYSPAVVTIQEISIVKALQVFSFYYHVYVNIEETARDNIGMCTLISKNLNVRDQIIGLNGRIIGIKLENVQIWNIYPKSGSQHKNIRETFFRHDLTNSLKVWKDYPSNLVIIGDYNCLHRVEDALNNPQVQPGLIKFMTQFKLKDDYIQVHGINANEFSRVTKTSGTRIDTAISNNSAECLKFDYIPYVGLDHKMILCEYSIPLKQKSGRIPKEKFISGWVVDKGILKDEIFLGVLEKVLEKVQINKDYPEQTWYEFKSLLIQWAKERSVFLKKEQNIYHKRLINHYNLVIEDIKNGIDCKEELCYIVQELNEFYKMKVDKVVERDKCLEIKENNEEIIKQQKESKYFGNGIDKIRINDNVYEDKFKIVEEIEKEMRKELENDSGMGFSYPTNQEEEYFLNMLPKLELSEEEREKLTDQINDEEISSILSHEVDLDSSPGLDGITYRCLNVLWQYPKFKKIYRNYLNRIKETGQYGRNLNISVMVLKNKKQNSIDYSQKRKLTKTNKEINLLAKIWSNRCRDILLPKIIPKNQYVCRLDANIIDELIQIRDLNLFLLGNNGVQNNGSILSLDFKDAFRSVNHRWFNLVMEHLGVPGEFIKFFWNIYKDLGIIISVNKIKSNIIYNKRGFAEGSAPSMAAFVMSTIALIKGLEKQLDGIKLADGRLFKVFSFADDQKLALKNAEEISKVQDTVIRFEKVSGLLLHRDVSRKKCNVLSFGNHVNYKKWPSWITKANKIKVIGAYFINQGNLEWENSIFVKDKCFERINANWSLKGTILQKAFFVNTFCLSKLNYISQAFIMDTNILEEITKLALKFIYAGENERPIRLVNFRRISEGGIGLIEPKLKAKALLCKSVLKDIRLRNIALKSNVLEVEVYGANDTIINYIKDGKMNSTSKEIYEAFIFKYLRVNSTLIPSRNEKKVANIKWSNSYRNYRNLSEIDPGEKELVFRFIQDLVGVPARLHQKVDKRCMRKIKNNDICTSISDREHFFQSCESIRDVAQMFKSIAHKILQKKNISFKDLLHFSYRGRGKNKEKVFSWVLVKGYKKIFYDKILDGKNIMKDILIDIKFAERNHFTITQLKEFQSVKEVILNLIK